MPYFSFLSWFPCVWVLFSNVECGFISSGYHCLSIFKSNIFFWRAECRSSLLDWCAFVLCFILRMMWLLEACVVCWRGILFFSQGYPLYFQRPFAYRTFIYFDFYFHLNFDFDIDFDIDIDIVFDIDFDCGRTGASVIIFLLRLHIKFFLQPGGSAIYMLLLELLPIFLDAAATCCCSIISARFFRCFC